MTRDGKGGGLGDLLGGSKPEKSDEAAPDIKGGKRDAAKRAMAAAKADDIDAFETALTEFVELCAGGDY